MKTDNQKAFSLIEVVMAMAIVLILAGVMLTGGKYMKTQAERQLTESAIEVIGTAMGQYYEQTSPEQFPPRVDNETGLKSVLSANAVTVSMPTPDADFWSGATAYFFLSRIPQSKAIMGSLAERMISNKDSAGVGVKVEIQMTAGGPTETYDWVRFVDAWGKTMRYTYSAGDVFPVITSAGPDKTFGTDDDLSSQ